MRSRYRSISLDRVLVEGLSDHMARVRRRKSRDCFLHPTLCQRGGHFGRLRLISRILNPLTCSAEVLSRSVQITCALKRTPERFKLLGNGRPLVALQSPELEQVGQPKSQEAVSLRGSR